MKIKLEANGWCEVNFRTFKDDFMDEYDTAHFPVRLLEQNIEKYLQRYSMDFEDILPTTELTLSNHIEFARGEITIHVDIFLVPSITMEQA